MTKVLVVVRGLALGGISSVIFSYYAALQKVCDDIQIDFACGLPIEDRYKNIITNDCRKLFLTDKGKNPLKYTMQIAKIVRREHYDVVHVHGNSAMITPDLLGAKIGGAKKIIAHSHNTTCNSPIINKMLKPLFYHLYTDALACGEDAGKWMFGNRPFIVMKNGVFLERYQFRESIRNEVRNELHIGNRYVIGHVGNFNYQKNHELLIEVFNEYHKKNSESILLLVGDGENRAEIEMTVSKMGIKDSVIFYGVSDRVNDLLMAMDCFVLTSRFEGLPCVLVEAQAAGLPCVVSDKVSKESKMSSEFSFAAIDNIKDWTCKIDVWRTINNRVELCKKNTASLTEHGYDIIKAAELLARIYKDESKGAHI